MATKESTTKDTAKTNDNVTITLPLTRERQEDVFVAVNGISYLIKRGEEVTIPKAVYEVLQNSERMDNLALRRSQDLQKKS